MIFILNKMIIIIILLILAILFTYMIIKYIVSTKKKIITSLKNETNDTIKFNIKKYISYQKRWRLDMFDNNNLLLKSVIGCLYSSTTDEYNLTKCSIDTTDIDILTFNFKIIDDSKIISYNILSKKNILEFDLVELPDVTKTPITYKSVVTSPKFFYLYYTFTPIDYIPDTAKPIPKTADSFNIPNCHISDEYTCLTSWCSRYMDIYFDSIPEPSGNLGLAYCGGGTRASSATLGSLKYINSLRHLDNSIIQYISANSGSTWVVLPLLYENGYSLDDMLDGNKLINYNVSFNNYNIDYKNSFFKKITTALVDPTTNWYYFVKNSFFPEKYNGFNIKNNVPMPISIATLVTQNCNIPMTFPPSKLTCNQDQDPYSINLIGVDFTPISSGCFVSPTKDMLRVETSQYISYAKDAEWSPALMSTFSSLAVGPQIVDALAECKYGIKLCDQPDVLVCNIGLCNETYIGEFIESLIDDLLTDVSIRNICNAEIIVNKYQRKYNNIIDGYLTDDTSIICQLARGVINIFSMSYPELRTLRQNYFDDPGNVEGDYVFIKKNVTHTSLLYESIGKIIKIDRINRKITVEFSPEKIYNNITVSRAKKYTYDYNEIYTLTSTFNTVWDCFESIGNSYEELQNSPPTTDKNYIRKKIMNMMGENYVRTGIYFTYIYFKTKTVAKFGIKPYTGKILFYLLSPCPYFYNNILSTENQGFINKICKWPNICTVAPILNDCNNDLQFDNKCLFCIEDCKDAPAEILPELTAGNKLQQLTKPETVSIAALTQYITEQLYNYFIYEKEINTIPYPFLGRNVRNLERPYNFDTGNPQTVYIVIDIGVYVDYNPQFGTFVKYNQNEPEVFGKNINNTVSLEYFGASMLNCYVNITNITDDKIPIVNGQITVSFPNVFTGERTVSFTSNNNYSNFRKFDGGNNGNPPAVIIFGPPGL